MVKIVQYGILSPTKFFVNQIVKIVLWSPMWSMHLIEYIYIAEYLLLYILLASGLLL